ncbi:MAG TPA: hypothetical protein DDY13_20025 [Cytophagales bacterium]|mgnify:FL=1|jgi:sigma-B regulation protein RsbU (phosphoserine phosphatase)|nr:hypothetical protein [Cytophagales bacterium]
MTKKKTYKELLDLKELELNALLEITQAINNNMPEASLYKIYNFTLRANLNIAKLALYVFDEKWGCKVNFGTRNSFTGIPLGEEMTQYEKITNLKVDDDSPFSEFEVVIPVAHKSNKLAMVFINGKADRSEVAINTNFVQALSNIIIVAIENKKLARRQLEQEMLRRELSIAGQLQRFLFPKTLPYNDHLKICAYYEPQHSIGGDYYDYIALRDDQHLFCVADVSGKGIPAAMLMSNFQASLRILTRQTNLLQDVITQLNHQIVSNSKGEHFITVFVAIYDRKRKRMKYVNSGHNPPYLIKSDGSMEELTKGSTILGAFDHLPEIEVGIYEDISDFGIFAYTDGLSEMKNDDEVEFGEGRILEVLEQNKNSAPRQIQAAMISAMQTFKDDQPLNDDITLYCCQVKA